jgi:hypothetical protein
VALSTEEKPGSGGGEYGESNIEPGEILERWVTSGGLSIIHRTQLGVQVGGGDCTKWLIVTSDSD